MPDFTPGATKLLAYWGNIQSSVGARASTASLWQDVRDAAAADNYNIAPANAIDMGQLRSIAVGNRTAMERLAALGSPGTITAEHIGTELFARSLAEQALAPIHLVRFEHNVMVDGELQTVWRTDRFEGDLPLTKDDLILQLNADAAALADEYSQTHVGIGAMSISAT
jgi:hypothetical protein